LQDIHLSNDDGVSIDDQAALVLTVEPTRASARKHGCCRRWSTHGIIMTEARIGRLVGACLHQAISERLPDRLEFYEYWLNGHVRDGRMDLAAMTAVMGFLRTEGEAYGAVTGRAGALAAEWTIASFSPVQRRVIAWLPRRIRTRAALRVAAGIVRATSSATRTSTRVGRRSARVEVRSSLFCNVREAPRAPLCGFYLAVALESLRRYGVVADGRIDQCHAMDRGAACVVVLELSGAAISPAPAIAA
jgi:hypothetical protein